MWGKGHNEFSDEASPHALTFADTVIVNMPPIVLQEGVVSLSGGASVQSEIRLQLPEQRPSGSSGDHVEGHDSLEAFQVKLF
jgi:hypothetical protein